MSALREAGPSGQMSPSEVHERLANLGETFTYGAVKQAMWRMTLERPPVLERVARGEYREGTGGANIYLQDRHGSVVLDSFSDFI